MGHKKTDKRISAIVPAYNEAERIGRVLDILTTYPDFKEIIVIDDGSPDGTEAIVRRYDVRYVKKKVNGGKGAAMDLGVKLAKGDVIFFCDADISGLTHKIIDQITCPVVNGEVEMFIGMRNRKIYFLISRITMGVGEESELRGKIDEISRKYGITTPYDLEDDTER